MTDAIQVAVTQHRGRVARSQQDAMLVGQDIVQSPDWPITDSILSRSGGLCAVADGVAISPVPHRASRAVLEALRRADQAPPEWWQDGWIGPRLIRSQVHPALCRQLAGHRRTHGAACTLALLQWRDERFSVINVGDSRVYRIRRDGVWQRLSKDHTYRQSMIERGEIGPDQSVGQLYDDLEHMLIADEAEDGFAVHWQQGDCMPGDTWMLCTDGVHDTLGEAQLMGLYHAKLSVTEQVSRYREAVLSAGAPDNLSLMMLRGRAQSLNSVRLSNRSPSA
ncbi:serine/threonine protein phosphatase [Lamprobacter modestohalophilus]|uniref:Serine/threonine protein phosphatase n=1 Tax=Lamprobacter modestohalophilus TaxID=1064514 RepID=A0A9X1B5P1_9GAMM|nr:protein phosphatase 2C domain-containing protein [Lamprobacter modestohalophilus]MBK1620730.1 serine/threonine protein phosphatase [Lamprobacter modestohalophilus]